MHGNTRPFFKSSSVCGPVLRFRSPIKLISAFYSIGMYKSGWTDYFLVPALDCRESRTHFLRTRTYPPRVIGVYCASRCIFLGWTSSPLLDTPSMNAYTRTGCLCALDADDDVTTTGTKSSPRDKKKEQSNLLLTIADSR